MAVNSIKSTLVNKAKKFGKNQKEVIHTRLLSKGEFPWYVQVLSASIFWLILFFSLAVVMLPSLRWLVVIIAMICSFGFVQLTNFIGKKLVSTAVEIEEETDQETLEVDKNSILIGDLYKKGGIVLTQHRRNKMIFTPIVLFQINSIASASTSSIFSSLSEFTMQKLSLKYHCSVIDTSKYEIILLKGSKRIAKAESLPQILHLLEEEFFNEAFDVIAEFQRDKRIDIESPNLTILRDLFPTHKNIVDLATKVASKDISKPQKIDSNKETKEIFDSMFVEEEEEELIEETAVIVDKEEEIIDEEDFLEEEEEKEEKFEEKEQFEDELISEDLGDRTQKEIVKDVLFQELSFSINGFISAAKGFYKKAIEFNMDKKYDSEVDKFLKLVQLYCDKEGISFFYPSFSYLQKIIEFLDIELPSSSDIENYTSKFVEEYISVTIPETHKIKLDEFLELKLKVNNGNKEDPTEDKAEEDTVKITTIPSPPAKTKQKKLLVEEM